MKLRPYPAYTESAFAGLSKIPSHWKILRNKYLLKERNRRSTSGDEELLTVSHYTGITKRKERISGDNSLLTNASSLVGYKIVNPDDLVMNIMLAWNGSLGVSPYKGIVSPAYCVFAINRKELLPKFIHYLHRTSLYTEIFKTVSTGVIESRLRLYPEQYFRLSSAYPSIKEQIQIIRFLNYKTSQISRFIRAKKRIIELLKEQKQVIINDAVTGKIDVRTGKPYPKYKESGVEWLGKVPEDWDVLPIKRTLKCMMYGTSESAGDEGDFQVLTMGHIKDGEVVVKNCNRLKHIDPELILKKEDMLFNRTNSKELVGKVGLFWGNELENITFASYLVLMRANKRVFSEYMNYLLNSQNVLNIARQSAIPSLHQCNLNPTRYSRLIVPLPPKDEQALILRACF